MPKDPRAEIEEYQKKLEQNPESLVFLPLAETYRKNGMWDEAIEVCQKGLVIHPTYMSARVCIGRAYMEKRMYAEALAEFKKVIEIEPNNILARSYIANIFNIQGELEKVLQECDWILGINPDNTAIQSLMAEVQAKLGIVPEQVESSKNEKKKSAPKEPVKEPVKKEEGKAEEVKKESVQQESNIAKEPVVQLATPSKESSLPGMFTETSRASFESDNITGDDLLSVMKTLGGMIYEKGEPSEPAAAPKATEPVKEQKVPAQEVAVANPPVSFDSNLEAILQDLNKKSGILGSMLVTPTGQVVVNAFVKGMDEKGAGEAGIQLFKKTAGVTMRMQWGGVGLIIICSEASQIILMETKKGILNVVADVNASFGLLKLALNETVKKINA